MLEFPYSLGTDDKNRVDIAILDHYGESYSRSTSLRMPVPTLFLLVLSWVKLKEYRR